MCFDKDALLEKEAYWREGLFWERGLLERGAYWTKGLIGERGLSEKEAFFVEELFWERGSLERGAYWKEGLFWREAFLGGRLIGERGFSSRKCLRYSFMVWSITVYTDFSGVDCGSKASYISFFFPFINSFISLCLHRVKTALQQFT